MGGIRNEIFRENPKIPSVEYACHLEKPIQIYKRRGGKENESKSVRKRIKAFTQYKNEIFQEDTRKNLNGRN